MAKASRPCAHPDVNAGPDAVSLGHTIQQMLDSSGILLMMKYPALYSAWVDLVGLELSPHARISAARHGTLEIAVSSSAVMQEISFRRTELLRGLQERTKKPYISRLIFVVRTEQEEHGEEAREEEQ